MPEHDRPTGKFNRPPGTSVVQKFAQMAGRVRHQGNRMVAEMRAVSVARELYAMGRITPDDVARLQQLIRRVRTAPRDRAARAELLAFVGELVRRRGNGGGAAGPDVLPEPVRPGGGKPSLEGGAAVPIPREEGPDEPTAA
ncbi:hypothetical protein WJS89_04600 [Sphingomicrobium sp. XHP0235]|uniref:hypothetical protein n=1 Tax=Sphingomicrobium aquimarinum TaxID=3133971 RepID=UPI0031FE9EB7